MTLFDRALAIGEETNFNVEAPVTRFLPLISDTIKPRRVAIENRGHIAGSRFLPAKSFETDGAEGSIEFEPGTNGMGLIIKHMLGALTTSAGPVGGTHLHVATPGDPTGKSLSWESNRPFADGSAAVLRASGGKVKGWRMGVDLDGTLSTSLDLSFATWRQRALTKIGASATSTTLTLPDTLGITAGMRVTGSGIPAGTTVVSTTATTVTLSAAATATASGVTFTFGLDAQQLITATTTAGSTAVTAVSDTTGMAVGQPITGPGIAPSTTIAAVPSATTLTLSKPTLAAATAGSFVVGITPTTPAYLSTERFTYRRTSATLQFNGAPAPVGVCLVGFSLEGDMGMIERRTFCGYKEAAPGSPAAIIAGLRLEWESWDLYRRYYADNPADTLASLVVTLEGATPITGTTKPSLKIEIPALQFEGAMPDAGEGVLIQDVRGMVVAPSAGQPITLTALTGSATP